MHASNSRTFIKDANMRVSGEGFGAIAMQVTLIELALPDLIPTFNDD